VPFLQLEKFCKKLKYLLAGLSKITLTDQPTNLKKMEATGKKISTVNKMASVSKKAAAVATEVEECMICFEPYNKSTRLPVECEQAGCKYKGCLECIRAYLLTSMNEPHCMQCKANWSAKFMLNLRKGWLSDVYRPHREKFLCDIELSKIAETMPDAERRKLWKKQCAHTDELTASYVTAKQELDKIQTKINESRRLGHQLYGYVDDPKAEKKVFFMPCPAVDCKGMLSTQYKCGICEMFACHDCHEVIGLSKTETPHTCDPNNVASALAIKNETKQCPGCHNRIFRVEGCSQMWCTGCHTAFDWNTGRKVVSERLHNPHWLEYQRGLNGGVAPRAPGDVPCGGLCSRNQVNTGIIIKFKLKPTLTQAQEDPLCLWGHSEIEKLADTLRAVHRIVEHITFNDVRETRERIQAMRDFKDERIKYILGDMTKQQLSSHIFRTDKVRQKNTEMLNVFELLSAVGIDMFNKLLANTQSGVELMYEVQEQIEQYNKLRIYCNGLFAVISNTYGMTVPHITKKWIRVSEKYNSKSLKLIEAGGGSDEAGPASASM